jgi:hypothetical protein
MAQAADPSKPKRPLSAYFLFTGEMRAKVACLFFSTLSHRLHAA